MQVSIIDDVKKVIAGVFARNKAPSWTLAIHNIAHLEQDCLEKMCLEVGFNICRKFQVCSISSVPSKLDIASVYR